MLKIEFNTDNAAFSDDLEMETVAILERITNTIKEGFRRDGTIRDTNGNTIGSWSLTAD